MLSDKEKISLNRMKLFARSSDLSVVTAKDMNIVVTLVEKQSKEIEELKEKNEYLPSWVSKKYVSKDKIKAKIEELEKLDFGTDLVSQFTANLTTITILQSLLEKE